MNPEAFYDVSNMCYPVKWGKILLGWLWNDLTEIKDLLLSVQNPKLSAWLETAILNQYFNINNSCINKLTENYHQLYSSTQLHTAFFFSCF